MLILDNLQSLVTHEFINILSLTRVIYCHLIIFPDLTILGWHFINKVGFCFVRELYHEWTVELKAMADRIITMRQELFDALQARGIFFSDGYFRYLFLSFDNLWFSSL